MLKIIIKLIIGVITYLAWMFTGGTQIESLFIAVIFTGILLLEPIPFQTKEQREELLEKERINRERIKRLHEQRKLERKMMQQESEKRAIRESRRINST